LKNFIDQIPYAKACGIFECKIKERAFAQPEQTSNGMQP